MAKRKGRAARKQQRQKAVKAQERGLPQAELEPKPQKTRKVGGDTSAAAMASEKAGRSGPARSREAAPSRESGLPTAAKVLIGAAIALVLVYGLSKFRKSGDVAPEGAESAEVAEESSTVTSERVETSDQDPEESEAEGDDEALSVSSLEEGEQLAEEAAASEAAALDDAASDDAASDDGPAQVEAGPLPSADDSGATVKTPKASASSSVAPTSKPTSAPVAQPASKPAPVVAPAPKSPAAPVTPKGAQEKQAPAAVAPTPQPKPAPTVTPAPTAPTSPPTE